MYALGMCVLRIYVCTMHVCMYVYAKYICLYYTRIMYVLGMCVLCTYVCTMYVPRMCVCLYASMLTVLASSRGTTGRGENQCWPICMLRLLPSNASTN